MKSHHETTEMRRTLCYTWVLVDSCRERDRLWRRSPQSSQPGWVCTFGWRAVAFPSVGDKQGEKDRVLEGMFTDLPPMWSITAEAPNMTLGALTLESGGKASVVAGISTQLPAISNAPLLLLLSQAALSGPIPAPSTCYEITRPGLIITLLALPSVFREGNNPSLCFSRRLSWLSPNILASAGSVNVTVVEMANPKATGIRGL